jgi:hypothetical protein
LIELSLIAILACWERRRWAFTRHMLMGHFGSRYPVGAAVAWRDPFSTHSPSPLKAISTLTGREISSVQTQREVRWQLMGQRNGLAVERRLDGGFEVRRGIDSSEFGRVEQTVHQCRDLGALFRA